MNLALIYYQAYDLLQLSVDLSNDIYTFGPCYAVIGVMFTLVVPIGFCSLNVIHGLAALEIFEFHNNHYSLLLLVCVWCLYDISIY